MFERGVYTSLFTTGLRSDARVPDRGRAVQSQVAFCCVEELRILPVGAVRLFDGKAQAVAAGGIVDAEPVVVGKRERFGGCSVTNVDDRARFIRAESDDVIGEGAVTTGDELGTLRLLKYADYPPGRPVDCIVADRGSVDAYKDDG